MQTEAMNSTTLSRADVFPERPTSHSLQTAIGSAPVLPACAVNRMEGVHTLRPGMTMRWQSGGLGAGEIASLSGNKMEADCYVFALFDPRSRAAEASRENPFGATGWMVSVRKGALNLLSEKMREVSFVLVVELGREVSREIFSQDSVETSQVSSGKRSAGLEFFPLTPAARLAVESVRRCPLAGACRMLVLSARCHDLLVEFVFAKEARPVRPAAMSDTEERVRSAAAAIGRRIDETPSLEALAREAGLSETTLKRGFRQVFGTTVFEYLRTLRMERARELLQSGQATVIEAATLVGYSNPSNFASAFRKKFGLNPKEFQLAARR
ncbi:MAG: AraC family transcriptional regulator [Nibricoccus sp.]